MSPDASVRPQPALHPQRGVALAILVGLGAMGVVLALQVSELFDLDRHALPKELVLHLTALLALALLLPRWARVEASIVGTLLAAWVAWSALSALFAANHWLALRSWGISFSGSVIYFAALIAARDGAGRLVVRLIALAGSAAALTSLAQAYGLDWDLLIGERAPGGTMGNRNFLAHLAAITMPLVALVTLEARGRVGRGLGYTALGLLAAAIVLTRSRAAWLALGMSLTVMGVAWVLARPALRPGQSRPAFGIPLLMALGVLLALVLPNRLSWRSDAPYAESLRSIVDYQEGSGRGRLIQYRHTLQLVAMDPVFGTGPGNWMVHYPRVTAPGDPSFSGADPIPTNPWPSSDWVAFLAERGGIGVLLLLGAGLAAALTAIRRLRNPDEVTGAIALLGVLVATVVAGLFDAVLLSAAPTLFTFGALGALLPSTGAVVSRDLPARRRAVIGMILLAALAVTAQAAAGVTAVGIAGSSRRREVLEEASRWDPGNHRLHLLLSLRGSCAARLPHARAAARLLPYHEWPKRALRACGR